MDSDVRPSSPFYPRDTRGGNPSGADLWDRGPDNSTEANEVSHGQSCTLTGIRGLGTSVRDSIFDRSVDTSQGSSFHSRDEIMSSFR